ncbi:MAG: tripartite tricarboxylate transporter substrate binding protein [Ottowia sp.]|uniref:Bug family tripartite tricarboxylate transporter substrate binding protein n=1 Tax=Ottowia sp. TaxID=1898956 RepID=UPI003C754CE1
MSSRLVSRLTMVLCAALLAMPVLADKYPVRPVTLVSPLPAGASTDVVTRAWMNCASNAKLAGQQFILMNKPGANGVVAAQSMRQVPSDGYTIMVAGMSQTTITPYTYKKMPYDPQKEFVGAALFGESTFVLVANAQSGIKSIKDLQAAAKASPKGIDFGIPAISSPAQLLSAAVAGKLGIQSTLVPMAGESGGITALLGNQIPVMVFLTGSAAQHIDSGKFIPLMTFTEQRMSEYPNVPSVVEALGDPTLARTAWIGITTKAGSPPEVTKAVDGWTKACLETPEFNQALKNALFTPKYVGQAEFANIVKRDIEFWSPWVKKLGISND